MSSSELTLDQLLLLENDSELLNILCPDTGIPVWAMMRNIVIRLIMSDLLYKSAPLINTQSRESHLSNKLSMFAQALRGGFSSAKFKSDILIFTTGIGYVSTNGKLFNRLGGYFHEELGPRSLMIEGIQGLHTIGPRFHNRISSELLTASRAYLSGRINSWRRKYKEPARLLAEYIEVRANDLFEWHLGEERKRWLIKICSRYLAGNSSRKHATIKLLKSTGAKLILVEEGCYAQRAILNSTAKQAGVVVAEFQHGMVTKGHDAYNISEVLEKSLPFKETLPDYFLAYGQWWTEQMNIPTQRIVIGNPHRSVLLQPQRKTKVSNCRQILVLGDGIETKMYLEFCDALCKLFPQGYAVSFRPHPLEKNSVNEMMMNHLFEFEIDKSPDIFDSLVSCYAAVAEISTGLFEAAGLAERIFVWDTPKSRFGVPLHPFESFKSATELSEKLQSAPMLREQNVNPDQIWANGWQSRFNDFVQSAVNS